MGVLKCGGAHFQRDCNARKKASNHVARGNRACLGPRVRAKESQKNQWCDQRCHKLTHWKKTKNRSSGLANSKSEISSEFQESAQTCLTDNSKGFLTDGTMAGVLINGMMTGVLLDGTKVWNKRATILQAHFRLEVWILVPRAIRNGLNG